LLTWISFTVVVRASIICAALAAALGLSSLVARAQPLPDPGVAPPPQEPPKAAGTELRGAILRRGDRVPIPGVEILIDGGDPQALSDGDGRFQFEPLPPGEHQVHLRGPVKADFSVTLVGVKMDVNWYVEAAVRYQTSVRGRRVIQETVEQTLSADEVKHIPGTQGDTLKAVQNLPGAARSPFNAGLLIVWGSAPNDTRTYVDGVYIPTLYHFGGLRSTVNGDMVSSLRFLPGGYGADYGRGLGGVIEVEGRRPREDGFHGFAQVDLIDVSTMVEGPITKNLSVAVAGRISWLNLFLPAFLTSSVQASPRYWDYQARLHYKASTRDDIDLFLFGSDDFLDLILKDPNPALTQEFDTHTYYHRGLVRWTHRFENGATFSVTPSVGYDLPYNLGVALGNTPFQITSGQLEYNLRAIAHIPLHKMVRLDAGIDYEGTRYNLDATQNLNGGLREGDNGGFAGQTGQDSSQTIATDHLLLYTDHFAPYAGLAITPIPKRLMVTAQLRVDALTFNGYPGSPRSFASSEILPEPRLAIWFQAHPRLALRAAIGVYHQAPQSSDFSTVFGNPKLTAELGIHYVVGVEWKPTDHLHIEAQGFYKDLRNLVVRAEHVGDAPLENGGLGRVYGGELLIREELWKNFFGWVSYTLSRSERRDHPDQDWRLFQYDQTHILTLLGSYKLPYGFQVGLRFRFVSGNPYTPAAGAYFDVRTDQYIPIWGATYSARLPPFHQLDLRIDKEFVFNRWKFVAYLDIENLYAAQSIEAAAYNYNFSKIDASTGVSGLPFLPVIGIRGEF
jgi:hypothetical protein